jgi:hypothetical protein
LLHLGRARRRRAGIVNLRQTVSGFVECKLAWPNALIDKHQATRGGLAARARGGRRRELARMMQAIPASGSLQQEGKAGESSASQERGRAEWIPAAPDFFN